MKQTHRSDSFDKLLNAKVRVTFIDGAVKEGTLKWKGYRGDDVMKSNTYYLALDEPMKSNTYYLALDEPNGPKFLSFRKCHVRRIEAL